MLIDVVSAKALDGYKLEIGFEDGTRGVVDVSKQVEFKGVFAALRDRRHFEEVFVNKELGVVSWPNGADLDADVLYSLISGEELPKFEKAALAAP